MTTRRTLWTAAVFLVGALAAGCGAGDQTNTSAASEPAAVEAETTTPAPTTPAPPAEPILNVTSSCENDFPLVIEPSTYSLVATGNVTNTGTVAGKAKVTVEWFPVGQDAYTATKTVMVEPGDQVRVPFSEKVPTEVMNGMVGLQHGDQMCDITVTPER